MSTDELVMAPSAPALDRNDGRRSAVPGEPGIWLLIVGDMLVFTSILISFIYQYRHHHQIFTAGQQSLDIAAGVINTVILLTSGLVIAFAVREYESAQYRRASAFIVAGMVGGVAFVVVKIIEYHSEVATGHTPLTNDFYMYYYTLTGLHLVHVVIGLGVLAGLLMMCRKRASSSVEGLRSEPDRAIFESGACFWHFVDLLWLLIFPVLFLIG